jgi:CRISPR-associated protein Cpf1
LFDEYGIDYHSNLLASILIQDNKSFFYNEDVRKPSLFPLIKLMVQLRNRFIKSDVDYISSPVADSKGIFYDSNNCGSHLPNNADANGAFNIARKGLMLVERILSTPSDKKLSLIITNEEWLHYVQSQNLINI